MKSRKFILTLYLLFCYFLAEIFFLVSKNALILEYLKLLTPAIVFAVLGYSGFNVIQKKIESDNGKKENGDEI